jgi:transmembrane sensor
MPATIDLAQLARYLDGTASAEEGAAVEAWVANSSERWATLNALKAVWEADSRRLAGQYDVDRAWHRLQAIPSGETEFVSGRRWFVRPALAAAVVATIAIGSILWLTRQKPEALPVVTAPQSREYVAARGQRQTFTLADGSEVTLNSETRLRVSSDYGASRRDVELSGEAYFNVAHDSARPFAVHTRHGVVRDLGTRFGVKAHDDATNDRIAVAEGLVAITPGAASAQNSTELRPGQVATLSSAGRVRVLRNANVEVELAWTRGRLVLDGVSLEEAAQRIGRWYDLDIQVVDAAVRRQPVSGSYSNEPVAEVLTLITAAVGARYDMQGQTVTIRALR